MEFVGNSKLPTTGICQLFNEYNVSTVSSELNTPSLNHALAVYLNVNLPSPFFIVSGMIASSPNEKQL